MTTNQKQTRRAEAEETLSIEEMPLTSHESYTQH